MLSLQCWFLTRAGQESKKDFEAAALPHKADPEPLAIGPVRQHEVALGPSLPPVEEAFAPPPQADEAPASPYTANRALLRDLTLPALPNLDIPPSPPGSPPPATTKKFEQFLELKEKGTHFNAKLAASSALRNPGLMDKLMDFVGLDDKDQYATTLPAELWNPAGFPEWAFRGPLKKSQDRIRKEREAEKASGTRAALDFVPASSASGTPTGKSAGSSGVSKGEKRKASRWDDTGR